MVRFIDNFSYGTRGSASAESFVQNSTAVIYMYRKKTLIPYERHLSNMDLLDCVSYSSSTHSDFKIDLTKMHKNFSKIFDDYNKAKQRNLLIKVEYSSIFEYLALLEFICKELNVLKEKAIVYLAAAVSDFYLPLDQMPKNKIQSSVDGLTLNLKPVPKVLGQLKSNWCPNAFVISFKLETDESLLIKKSIKALDKYKHNLVIANILETRRSQVIVIEANQDYRQNVINLAGVEESVNDDCDHEIETDLVELVLKLHSNYKLNNC
jgi:phosphopantothenate-cysteine ligase